MFLINFSFVKTALILAISIFLINLWLSSKGYLFTEESIAAVARKHAAQFKEKVDAPTVEAAYKRIHAELVKKYPGHILPKKDLQWMFVNAGGWMGSMCMLHASLTEYVLFFGVALDTSGHSGRYWANISDTLLTGEFNQWKEGELKMNSFHAGDTVFHAWGEATSVNFKAGTWMVEYGRGFIPSTLGFALADTFFSTLDFVNLYYILRIYTKALLLEAKFFLTIGVDSIAEYL